MPPVSRTTAKRMLKHYSNEPMTDDDIQYLLRQFKLKDSDRSAAVMGGAVVDRVLLDRLMFSFRPMQKEHRDRLTTGDGAPLATLSARTKIAFALDIITPIERDEIDCIREVRNAFAHSIRGLTFDNPEVAALCDHLVLCPVPAEGQELPPKELFESARFIFISSCIAIMQRLVVDSDEAKQRIIDWMRKNEDRM